MKIDCAYDELIELHKLTPHPKNANRHSPEQIERLAKIIDYQGMRAPIVVSKRSGFIVKGHCRLEALLNLGYEKAPVNYQDYDSEAQEYSDIIADNEIARWAQLDMQSIHTELELLEIDVELLGIEKFDIDLIPEVKNTNEEIDVDNFGNDLEYQCPKCGFEFNG